MKTAMIGQFIDHVIYVYNEFGLVNILIVHLIYFAVFFALGYMVAEWRRKEAE